MKNNAIKKANLWYNTLAAKMPKEKKKKDTWANSKSKAALCWGMLSGDITGNMTNQ